MSIPSIDPYPMPAAAEMPPDTASHRVDPGRAALLIHDMQEDALRPFPPGGHRSPNWCGTPTGSAGGAPSWAYR